MSKENQLDEHAQLVTDIIIAMRKAIRLLNDKNYPNKHLAIFMPTYLKTFMERVIRRIDRNHEELVTEQNSFVFMGANVQNGYEQDRIIVSNCGGLYPPERIICYTIKVIGDTVHFNEGLNRLYI